MSTLRVAVLDDSDICRAQLREFLQADGDIAVTGEAPDGENVLQVLERSRAQLLVVDLAMPRANGHETISRVMANAPLPILVVTGQPLGPGREAVFESVRRGALALAEKPSALDRDAQQRLRETVRRLAPIPVVRHVEGKLHERPARVHAPPVVQPRSASSSAPLVVGVGSSAGGPMPLATLLGAWSKAFEAAVVVVQHLPPTFSAAFAEFLAARTALEVVAVGRPCALQAGHVYLSEGDFHLAVTDARTVGPVHAPARDGHRPSIDLLFESLARHAGDRASGIILSGIGHDGTAGLLAMRARGALCLAQDQASAAVWGMPRSALESGAASETGPPLQLAESVRQWAASANRKTG